MGRGKEREERECEREHARENLRERNRIYTQTNCDAPYS